MTILDDWCTTCRTHRAPKPGGQCPVCAPTPDDLLEQIDAALVAEDERSARRHRSSSYARHITNDLDAYAQTFGNDTGPRLHFERPTSEEHLTR